MNPEELWETTLNPENRTILKFNILKVQKKNLKKIKK